ncbi:hypothetical protein CCP4SC76_4850003 [Gammaproteobacteria bacterium]
MINVKGGSPGGTSSHWLTVTQSGQGKVDVSPAGMTCNTSSCTGDFSDVTTVTLTATPANGQTFTGWQNGDCIGTGICSLAMDSDKTASAIFSGGGRTCFATSRNLIYKSYIGYYSRCPDQEGFSYWCGRLEGQGGNLGAIISAFGTSTEYTRGYSGLDDGQRVDRLYQNLFSHKADSGGLVFYLNRLNQLRQEWANGHDGNYIGATEYALSRIVLDILNGAAGEDVAIINAKQAACPSY